MSYAAASFELEHPPENGHEGDTLARASVERLEAEYASLIRVDPRLTRKAVSFQANKDRPVIRWYKYKEGFSAELVQRYLSELSYPKRRILDPFAGSGTTLTQCASDGFASVGIELLPIGQLIIETRMGLLATDVATITRRVNHWIETTPWKLAKRSSKIPTLRITDGAYPVETERLIGNYLQALSGEEGVAYDVLTLALMSILECVSFTRKDGQYLRWDYRSGRNALKSRFDKGRIAPFDDAITEKLQEISKDLNQEESTAREGGTDTSLYRGSCLDILPQLESGSFGGIITSPPYCNRYDYTRTYALEHALMGGTEEETKRLRQAMLTCTVENRRKDLLSLNSSWGPALEAAGRVEALEKIVSALRAQADVGRLNNPNIGRMVEGYFAELSCVIFEFSRLLAKGGKVVMVNDNVRYGGINIPVDCILSEIAGHLGFKTLEISALPRGKGNSSQQMGAHGREELRKAVYIWEKI